MAAKKKVHLLEKLLDKSPELKKIELRTDNNEFDPQYEREQAALSVWRILANSEKQTICAKHKLGSVAEVERQLHRVTNIELHTLIAVALDDATEPSAKENTNENE